MTCATYKLSLNHKTSVTVMFSKALNFTKDKSKSDLVCILTVTAGIENLHTVAVMTLYSMRSKSLLLLQLFLLEKLPKVVDILSHVNCGKCLRNLNNRTSEI